MNRLTILLSTAALSSLGHLAAQAKPVPAPAPRPEIARILRAAEDLRRAGDDALADQLTRAAHAIARTQQGGQGEGKGGGAPAPAPARAGRRAIAQRVGAWEAAPPALRVAPAPSAKTPAGVARTARVRSAAPPAPIPPQPPRPDQGLPAPAPGAGGVVHHEHNHHHEVHHYFHGAPPDGGRDDVGRGAGGGRAPAPRVRAVQNPVRSDAPAPNARRRLLNVVAAPDAVTRLLVPGAAVSTRTEPGPSVGGTRTQPAPSRRAMTVVGRSPAQGQAPAPVQRPTAPKPPSPPAAPTAPFRRAIGVVQGAPAAGVTRARAVRSVAPQPSAPAVASRPDAPAKDAASSLASDVDGLRREVEELRALMQKLRDQLRAKRPN
ncbi:MAG: hypothetical protein R3F56_09970 [Planctomycetota bacterium]